MEDTAFAVGEPIARYDEEQSLAIRQFCIDALAAGVPKYRSREEAADIVVEWFPADRLALATLYRKIADNHPPKAA
jgi:hypothetical protein